MGVPFRPASHGVGEVADQPAALAAPLGGIAVEAGPVIYVRETEPALDGAAEDDLDAPSLPSGNACSKRLVSFS